MNAHIGVDAGTDMAHTVEVTLANAHDVKMAEKLIREDDDMVYGDFGYLGLQKRPKFVTTGTRQRLTSASTTVPL